MCASTAVLLTSLAASPVVAGPIPAVEIDLQVSNGFASIFNPAGTNIGGGLFNYAGSLSDPDFLITWDFNAAPDPAGVAQIGSNFTFSNLSAQTLEFVLTLTLPLTGGTGTSTDYAGSAAWGLTGVDGELATLGPGQSLWEALLDGVEVASIYDHPNGIVFSGPGSGSLMAPPISGVGPGVLDTIGVRLNFSITPGETATVSGVFAVIPAPGALALLGLAGLRRRRRRS